MRRQRTLPAGVRITLTHDQGKEMASHQELAQHLKSRVYLADPNSPWQRPTNENNNGLFREYLPKEMDLSNVSLRRLGGFGHQPVGWAEDPLEAQVVPQA